MTRLVLIGTGWLMLAGCGTSLPQYRWEGQAQALQHIRKRGEQVKSFSGECDLLLSKPGGLPMRFEGALAVQLPDQFRLRAWKGVSPAMDLTANRTGLWLWASNQSQADRGVPKASAPSEQKPLQGLWSPLGAAWFDQAQAKVLDAGGPKFLIHHQAGGPGGVLRVAEIDRATLTVQGYEMRVDGKVQFRIQFDQYRQHEKVVWPRRWVFVTGQKKMEMVLRSYQFNPSLPEAAFKPPSQARRIH